MDQVLEVQRIEVAGRSQMELSQLVDVIRPALHAAGYLSVVDFGAGFTPGAHRLLAAKAAGGQPVAVIKVCAADSLYGRRPA
jgi:hypothetical protein